MRSAVGRIGVITPHIPIDPRSASRHAYDAQILRYLGLKDPSVFQAVVRGLGGMNQGDQISKLSRESFDRVTESIHLPSAPISSDPTDADHASQKAISRQLLVQR